MDKDITFKVTAYETFSEGKPTYIRISNISNHLERCGLFKSLGKSRIDGYPMFTYDTASILRKMKLDKLLYNKYINYRKKAIELLGRYSGDIEIIKSLKECIPYWV